MDAYIHWIWLSLALSPNSPYSDLILQSFSYSASNIFNATKEEIEACINVPAELLNKLSDKDLTESQKILDYCINNGVGLLTYDSSYYPQRLKNIERAPVLLYFRGKMINFDDNVGISVVGTRTYSDYGKREAYRLAFDLATCGAVVISGMARGLDSFAHKGALDAKGHTVAVLGCGINIVYPPENEELMDDIISHGTVLTEYPPYTDPFGPHFPARNRIISGLSLGTLVIEANQRSGALITANYALKQGRDLFAVPGKNGDANSSGTNQLIASGAKIVRDAEDVLSDYQFYYPDKIAIERVPKFAKFIFGKNTRSKSPKIKTLDYSLQRNNSDQITDNYEENKDNTVSIDVNNNEQNEFDSSNYAQYSLNDDQLDILLKMPLNQSISIDNLSREGIPVSKISGYMTIFELKKLVVKLPGNLYKRVK